MADSEPRPFRHDPERDVLDRECQPGLPQHVQRRAPHLSQEGNMRARHCAGTDIREVDLWIENTDGAVDVVGIHDKLPKLYLESFDLGGDLCLLADQAGDQVVIFHGPILEPG